MAGRPSEGPLPHLMAHKIQEWPLYAGTGIHSQLASIFHSFKKGKIRSMTLPTILGYSLVPIS